MPTKTDDNGAEVPKKLAEYTKEDKETISLNARAKNVLYCALGPTEFNRVADAKQLKKYGISWLLPMKEQNKFTKPESTY